MIQAPLSDVFWHLQHCIRQIIWFFSFFILQLIDGGRIQLCFLTLKAPFLKEFDVKEMDRCMMQFSKRFENARDVASRIC